MVDQDYSELQKKLVSTEEAYLKLLDENKKLVEEQGSLLNIIDTSKLDVKMLLAKWIELRNPVNTKTIHDGRGKVREVCFSDWEKMVSLDAKRPLEEKLARYIKEAGALRGALFSSEMNRIMNSKPDYRNVAFVYYDFSNQRSLYTPKILEIFGITDGNGTRDLTLMKLIEYIPRKNRTEIIRAFRDGKPLERYEFILSSETNKNLILNGYPLVYDGISVGVGAFFYDKDSVDNKRYTLLRFGVEIKRAIVKISNEFEVIRDRIKK